VRIDSAGVVNQAILQRAQQAPAQRQAQSPAPGAEGDSLSIRGSERTEFPGKALGIQKMIDAGRAVPAAQHSRVGAALAQAEAPPADQADPAPAQPGETGSSIPDPARFNEADIAYLNEAFGTRDGDAGFRADYDFNSDGVIDGADLGSLLGRFGELRPEGTGIDATRSVQPFTEADVEALQVFFGAREGETGFVQRFDLNSDGVIDGADLGSMLGSLGAPTRDPGLEEAPQAPEAPADAPRDEPTLSPVVEEAIGLADAALAQAGAEATESVANATEVLEASDLLRVLDGLREETTRTLEADAAERSETLASFRESLLSVLLAPSRTDAQEGLLDLIDRLGAGA